MFTTTVTCSWCHAAVLLGGGPTACPDCGHEAGVPRMDCRCPRCRSAARTAAEQGYNDDYDPRG